MRCKALPVRLLCVCVCVCGGGGVMITIMYAENFDDFETRGLHLCLKSNHIVPFLLSWLVFG